MANYKGHIAGGVVFTGVYTVAMLFAPVERLAEYASLLYDWQAMFAVFVIGMLFALFPDVDTNSKGQDLFYWIIFPLDVLAHHRGWTHSKWAMFLIPLPIILIPWLYSDNVLPISLVYYGAAVVGYFSHLFLDGLIWKRFRIKN